MTPPSLPTIDFSLFSPNPDEDRLRLTAEVVRALEEVGFFYLVGHNLARSEVDEVFRQSKLFFSLPPQAKDAVCWENPRANRGYTAQGRERASLNLNTDDVESERMKAPDVKETYEIGRENDPQWKNRWPADHETVLPSFKDTMTTFFERCSDLHLDILRAAALGLGLDGEFFTPTSDERYHNLRLLHYPSVSREAVRKGECERVHAHTDYGSITLLFQDEVGGLEVHDDRSGSFVPVAPMPGAIIVNAGDAMRQWTNGRFKSALHRVTLRPDDASDAQSKPDNDELPSRYSVAFFCNPNYDAIIECIPGCETWDGAQGARWERVAFGDYITGRLAATYK